MSSDEPALQGVSVHVPVLRLVGELDITQAGLVRRQLQSYVRATDTTLVLVDLSQVSFIDCAGLEPLLTTHRWLLRRNRRLVLRPVSDQVEFLLTGLRRAGSDYVIEHAKGSGLAAHDGPAVRLRRAADGQPLIDQATGLLMAVHGSSAAHAFGLLTQVSQKHSMTVGDLAGGLAGLAAARGGRTTLNLTPGMREAVRGVLTYRAPGSPTAHPGRE